MGENRPESMPWLGAMTRRSSTTRLAKSGLPRIAARTASRPPSTRKPVRCVSLPVSSMPSGMLNMSTLVVLQYMPVAS